MGLDPGSNGGVVVLDEGKQVIAVFKTPDNIHDWVEKLAPFSGVMCITEKVHSMPGNGGKADFSFGYTVGTTHSCLTFSNIPYQEITPQTWMKMFSLKKEKTQSKTEWKNTIKNMAIQMFPDQKVTLWNADAFMIAEYCRRTFK